MTFYDIFAQIESFKAMTLIKLLVGILIRGIGLFLISKVIVEGVCGVCVIDGWFTASPGLSQTD